MFLSDPNLYGVTHPYKEFYPQFLPQTQAFGPQFFGPPQPPLNPWIRAEQFQTPFIPPTMFHNPLVGPEPIPNPFITPTMFHNPLVRPEPMQPPFFPPTMFHNPLVVPEQVRTPFGVTPKLPYGYNPPFFGWNRPWTY